MTQPQVASRGSSLPLMVIALAQLIVGLDYNIVFVALPEIGTHVGFTEQSLQWVISAYAVFFGGVLLLGGRMADLFGKRRIFFFGLALYGVASLVGGLANQPWLLIAARAVQGIGGAFLAPATLALVATMFEEGAERNRALGVWGASGSSGMVLGSVLGGVLTQWFGWEFVFFINLPLAGLVIGLGWLVVPADGAPSEGKSFDLGGAVTITAGATLLVFSLVEGPGAGWTSTSTFAALVASGVFLIAFLIIESISKDPLIPLGIFRKRNLACGTAITFIFMASFGALAYFFTIYLQQVLSLNSVNTGLAFVIPCVSILLGTIIGGKLSTAIGIRLTLIGGLFSGAVGAFLFASAMDVSLSIGWLLPGVLIVSLAQGTVFTAMFAAATTGMSPEQQGLAGGVATCGQQIGAAVGLACLVAIANTYSGVGPSADTASIANGLRVAMYAISVLILVGIIPALALQSRPAANTTDQPNADETERSEKLELAVPASTSS